MTSQSRPDIGIMFRCQHAPEQLVDYAQQAEAAGFDELWVVEDCFFAGGVVSAATALARTRSIRVGLGVLPAVVRNPAFAAMELATLARLHPGRFVAGLGHGVGEWMQQIGAFPQSQLAALEEVTVAVRRLLAGEQVTMHGAYANLDVVQLAFPPQQPLPVLLGVRGPKSLALAGRVADGTILAECAAPAYVRWAREQIDRGQQAAGHTDHHRLVVYAFCSIDADPEAAHQCLRPIIAPIIASGAITDQLVPLGIASEVDALLANGGAANLATAMPNAWIDQLAVAGTPADGVAAIERLAAAGADAVVLVPLDPQVAALEQIAQELLPLLGA